MDSKRTMLRWLFNLKYVIFIPEHFVDL